MKVKNCRHRHRKHSALTRTCSAIPLALTLLYGATATTPPLLGSSSTGTFLTWDDNLDCESIPSDWPSCYNSYYDAVWREQSHSWGEHFQDTKYICELRLDGLTHRFYTYTSGHLWDCREMENCSPPVPCWTLPPPPPNELPDNTGGGSPILIDLDGGGLRLTDLAGGVLFDIDGDGAREQVSWTVAGSGDAWLTYDRNGNGEVDSGRELFGDATEQPTNPQPHESHEPHEPHGFLALLPFDSDGDGAITSGDRLFPALRLWVDLNHDGQSHGTELLPLAPDAVLFLEWVESRARDQHGNEFRYRSRVWTGGERGRTVQAVDVFLLH